MVDSSSITGLSGISGDMPQRNPDTAFIRKNQRKARPATPTNDQAPLEPAPSPIGEATVQLIEALDRLRATNDLAPGETELARTLRGVKYYQEESRTGLPIIADPASSSSSTATPDATPKKPASS
jgi:hypothetical protein